MFPLDGNWQGATTQGRAIRFTVQNNLIIVMSISLLANGAQCPATEVRSSARPLTISGPHFSWAFESRLDDVERNSYTYAVRLVGQFRDNTTATGYINVNYLPSDTRACYNVTGDTFQTNKVP